MSFVCDGHRRVLARLTNTPGQGRVRPRRGVAASGGRANGQELGEEIDDGVSRHGIGHAEIAAEILERVAEAAERRDHLLAGIDINDGYIADARRRHSRDFRVADVTRLTPGTIEPADMVLVNSLLHHLDDEETHRTLSSLPQLVTADGMVHILDLVLPDALSPARALAKLDRGRYPRRVDDWRSIVSSHFHEQIFEPYTYAGLWAMVYFRGSVKT